ncbi:pisatin demethylase [Fusarium sp. NRRL 25303]|nr:pisatin demethylase [Fusarium sp. NRRL 25303]
MGLFSCMSEQRELLVYALIGLYVINKLVVYFKLRQFGGPRWTGVSDWPHSWAMLQDRCHKLYEQVNLKHGPIARVAPNILITSSPKLWIQVNSKPGYKRSDWYYNACRIEHRRDNVFNLTDNQKHEQRRKQMAPGYSGRENRHLETSIDERVQEFVDLIRNKYLSSETQVIPMDLAQKVQYLTLDVISGIGFGKTFGMVKNDSDVDDWLAHAPIIGRFIAPSPKDNNGFGKMIAACYRAVDERAANPTDQRSDMLASFIRHGISGDDLRSEALEQLIAGADTTSTGIRGALLYIMTNPRVYQKLQREVYDAILEGKNPDSGQGIITLTQTKKLPYLQAVIREALRLWPPAVNIFSRDTPPGGDTVTVNGESIFLPGGVSIGYSAYGMHHSQEVYGKDAKVFRPERWLKSDPDKLAAMIRTNELVFGHGRFQCLGRPVAQLEL